MMKKDEGRTIEEEVKKKYVKEKRKEKQEAYNQEMDQWERRKGALLVSPTPRPAAMTVAKLPLTAVITW